MRRFAAMTAVVMGSMLLCACHGPLPAQTFGMEPITDPGPYRNRLAAHKLRGDPAPTARASRRPAAAASVTPVASGAVRPGVVRLRKEDLRPVKAWFSGRNEQFILGDTVEIVASKEYFSQVLTANAHVRTVRKTERTVGDDRVVSLKYIGGGLPSVMNNPRVFIGTGFTATARDTLHIRLTNTRDATRPVTIRIVARGDAARGRDEKILQRGGQLEVRGVLRWDRASRRWHWSCQ